MGKKPVLGLVGLFVGLTLSGCKDCPCWGNKDKEAAPPTARMRKPKPDTDTQESAMREETAPPEDSIATRGANPRRMRAPYQNPDTYNYAPPRGVNEAAENTPPADTGAPMMRQSVPPQEKMGYREQQAPVMEHRNPATLTSEQGEAAVPPEPPALPGTEKAFLPKRGVPVDSPTTGAAPAPRSMTPAGMMGGNVGAGDMPAPRMPVPPGIPAKKNDGMIDVTGGSEPKEIDLPAKGAPSMKSSEFVPPSGPPQAMPGPTVGPNPMQSMPEKVEKPAGGPEIINNTPPTVPPPSN
jgi:hypothetical protein